MAYMVTIETVAEMISELVYDHDVWRKDREEKYIKTATDLLLNSHAGEKIGELLGEDIHRAYVCNRNWNEPSEIRVRFTGANSWFTFEVTPGLNTREKIIGIYTPRGGAQRSIPIERSQDLAKYLWLKSRR